jgi:tetratricopeptide (TPR) repeat protein
VLAATAALYAVFADHPFVYDDLRTVRDNLSLRTGDLTTIVRGDRFRPLTNLSFAVDHALWQLRPRGVHLTALFLHLANVALTWAVARRLAADAALAPLPLAGAVAGLFALHPLQSEAVTYASGRSELLAALLVLLGFLAWRRWVCRGGARFLAAGLAALAAGALAKETAAMLPLAVLAYDRLLVAPGEAEREPARRRLLRVHLPLLAVVAAAGALRVALFARLENPLLPREPWVHASTQAVVLWRYLRLLLVPAGQSIVHDVHAVRDPLDWRFLLALAALVAATVVLVRARRRSPLAVFGAAWFAIFLLPSSSLVPLHELMAEHRLYLASMGAFLALAAVAVRLLAGEAPAAQRARRRLAVAAAALVLVALGALTAARLQVWRDPVSLWSDAARRAPRTWAAFHFLGNALRDAGDCRAAAAAWERAVALWPDELGTHVNLGICRAQIGDTAGARAAFEGALRRDPRYVPAFNNLGRLALFEGDAEEAQRWFETAVGIAPGDRFATTELARLLRARGERRRADALCWRLRDGADLSGVERCLRAQPQPRAQPRRAPPRAPA